MMEAEFDDDLRLLINALRQETFRFILIGHNRYSIYVDIAARIRSAYPDRTVEIRLTDKDYRQIIDEIIAIDAKIVLIPDFGWLFRTGNEDTCVAFNQRRDAFAKLNNAYICFIEPNEFTKVPDKVPDWWSLRSLELDFFREDDKIKREYQSFELTDTSLGGQLLLDKRAEIDRLLKQISSVDSTNLLLLSNIYLQIGKIQLELSEFAEAEKHFDQSLLFAEQVSNTENIIASLNNISNIYMVSGKNIEALNILKKSLELSQNIKDIVSEGVILNNLSQIHQIQGDYITALSYLKRSLFICKQTDDVQGEAISLNNISQVYYRLGEYTTALTYLQQSLTIRKQIGDLIGEGTTLNNIGQIYSVWGDYKTALHYLQQSLVIRQRINDKQGESSTLNNISSIYQAQDNNSIALSYLQISLSISKQIGDKQTEAITQNNISQIYLKRHEYKAALEYLQRSLLISQELGNKHLEAVTMSNIAAIYLEQSINIGDTFQLFKTAHNILTQIGSPDAQIPKSYLDTIREQVGEERYNQLIQST